MEIINKKGPIDSLYSASLEDKEIGIYARNLPEARQRAIVHFRPKKKKLELLEVVFKG